MSGPQPLSRSVLAGRALSVGLALGVGVTARVLVGRATRRRIGEGSGLVDWDTVERLAARRLRGAQGSLSRAELDRSAHAYARAMTRIVPLLERRLGAELPGVVERHAVVDRAGWAHANIGVFRELVGHLEDGLRLPGTNSAAGSAAGMAGIANRYLTTRQIAFLLGYLGTRVLGQYDVALLSAEQAPGRLLFVEENIRASAATLGVPLDSFRVWIALHETTHAFEMEAHPWLRPYLKERLERQVTLFLDEANAFRTNGLRHLLQRWRSVAAEGSLSGFMTPEQRGLMRETQLIMSLLEGFSDWVMDEVGDQVVPNVRDIRRRFEARRAQRRKGLDRLVGRLTGLDLKMEQYRRGERFVAGVWAAGGDPAIGHLWDGPLALPTEVQRVVPEAVSAASVRLPGLAAASATAAAVGRAAG